MRQRVAVVLFAALALRAESFNVNSRYTVETVEIVPDNQKKMSSRLKSDIRRLIGKHLDQAAIDSLRERLKSETGARRVGQRLVRGGSPQAVKVVFEVERCKHQFDIEIPKATYYAGQGVSGGIDGVVDVAGNRFAAGYVNDGEERVERFAGLRTSYERRNPGSRYGLRLEFQDYHSSWEPATIVALRNSGPNPDLYHSRRGISGEGSIHFGNSFVYSAGISVQSLQMQFSAARTEAANAAIQSLRFHRRWRAADTTQSFEAGYRLHAATNLLGSDFAYARQLWDARYRVRRGSQEVSLAFRAGSVGGQAPLFERFVAGNSTCLRGWDKYELAPAGKARIAAGTVEYTYKLFQAFYDMGNAWNPGELSGVRHSLGAGIRAGARGPLLSLAFPLRAGNVTPIFFTTLNF